MKLTKDELLEVALEAIGYVGRANYSERERTATCWLERMWDGKTDMSIDQVSDALEEAHERASGGAR